MTTPPPLRIEPGEAIDWIVLDRPDAANAFSSALLDAFSEALERLETQGAPVIGIRGAGKGFSAGVDLGEYHADSTPAQDVARRRRNLDRWLAAANDDHARTIALIGRLAGQGGAP